MAFADQPAPHGATKLNFHEKKPYVYQKYPSTRNHPDGSSVMVKDAEEDAALGPEWRDTPYPQPEKPVPPPEPTFDELKAEHVRLIQANGLLKSQIGDLQLENEDLKLAIQQNQMTKENKKSGKPKTEAAA